jgi:putative phage-type endonuclease
MNNYTIINLEQGSPAWFEWRSNGITATDMSVLTKDNPFRSEIDIFDEKCNLREHDEKNAAMEHGHKYEIVVRDYLNAVNEDRHFVPLCVEGAKLHYKASLDAFDVLNSVLYEIKCPVSEKILADVVLSNTVPNYWKSQLAWQCSIVHPETAAFAVYDYRTKYILIVPFELPKKEEIERMQDLADDFWCKIQWGARPNSANGLYASLDDPQLISLLEEYDSMFFQEKTIIAKRKELREKILAYGNGNNFSAGCFDIARIDPRDSYDYEKMRADGIDLEKYLKPKSGENMFRITKKRKS